MKHAAPNSRAFNREPGLRRGPPDEHSFPAGAPPRGAQTSQARQPVRSNAFVSISEVGYRYRGADRDALSDISFDIPRGVCFGLLGPNGAGKTTLFGLLTGALKLQRGEICVAGLSARRELTRMREIGAIAPQDLSFYSGLTGRENLAFFAGAYRLENARLRERLSFCVEACALEDVLDKPAETYSGGMKRRLNLAIALLAAPQILYLDEPTVGIDARSRQTIVDVIGALKDQGVTIIYTSHYMEEVEALCDMLVVIDRGRIVESGGKEDVLRRHAGRALHVTLETPLPEAARASLTTQGARWRDDIRLDMPAADASDVARALERIAQLGGKIAHLQFGMARLEQTYLSLVEANTAT
jgi:ABC-2 type transport system ATP-binding protein